MSQRALYRTVLEILIYGIQCAIDAGEYTVEDEKIAKVMLEILRDMLKSKRLKE